ncbi:MAG TPA: SH3 domain-containing protein [Polyangia bacterium]|nr:SH3 domain-containing protein [Polyangia bacterium]
MRTRLSLVVAAAVAALTFFPLLAQAQQKERAQFESDMEKAMPSAKPGGRPAPASDGDADGKLGNTEMRKANRTAAEILKRRMEQERPDDAKILRAAVGADVVVVSGVYDRVQDVLRAVEVKHVVIPPSLLDRLDLLPTQTLMVNCPGQVSPAGIKKIHDFVARGGYLVTTDWAINVTAKAFPGTIEHNGQRTPNDVVAVTTHDANEPLLSHMKGLKDKPRWWLENASFPIRILDQKKVRVLMSSDEMKKKYGEGAVVVAFRFGDGKVLHMTSHFYLQQAKLLVASEKRGGSAFAKDVGLSDADVAAMKKKGVNPDDVRAGEVNSAYSMQQVSANLLVEKQRENDRLIKERYNGTITLDNVPLAGSPALATTRPPPAAPPPPAKAGSKPSEPPAQPTTVKRDYRVQVLEQRGDKVKVRDLFGNEGWVPAQAVKK